MSLAFKVPRYGTGHSYIIGIERENVGTSSTPSPSGRCITQHPCLQMLVCKMGCEDQW